MKKNSMIKIKKNKKSFIKKYLSYDFMNFKFNGILAFLVILMGVLGLFVLLSASSYLTIKFGVSRYYYLSKQVFFFIFGVILMFIISKINFKIFYDYAVPIFIISVFLLVLCYVPGISVSINGAKRVINLGVSFMPSDIAKISSIIFLAWFISKNDKESGEINFLIKCMIIILIPFSLILFQTDLSTSIVVAFSLGMVYIIGGFNRKFLPVIIIIGVVGLFLLSKILIGYQVNRIKAFINPEAYYDSLSWQVLNGLFAVTRGGVDGVGFGKSIYKQGYLGDEVNSDMIFSVIAEEFGFFISALFIIMIFIITFLVINESLKSKNKFEKMLLLGISLVYFSQSLINVGVSMSIIPNTGITLPFISNGGTSLITFYLMFGIVLNISRKNNFERINLKNKEKQNIV